MIDGDLHHVGLACRSIERERLVLEALGAVPDGDPFTDPGLGIRGQFVRLGSSRIELLEEWEASGVLEPWLRGGSRVYHLAYLVDDVAATLASLAPPARLVRGPQPAIAFEGRPVAFVMTSTLLLLELIER